MRVPKTRYTRSGGVHVAYQVFGNGPIDVVSTPGNWTHDLEGVPGEWRLYVVKQ